MIKQATLKGQKDNERTERNRKCERKLRRKRVKSCNVIVACFIKWSTQRLASTFSVTPSLRHTGSIIQPVDMPCCSSAPCCLSADIIHQSRLQNSNAFLLVTPLTWFCSKIKVLQVRTSIAQA